MTVYIIDIEAVDTRYTAQWKKHLPEQLRKRTDDVVVISGGETPQATTPGAFLNFGGTNVYKSKQLEQIGEMFCAGTIKTGDYFLYTDAWNPTVIQLRYMAELLGVDICIGGMWHAGSYDPQDFLGRLIGDAAWVRHAEKSMFWCYDHNYFATEFHLNLFAENLLNYKGMFGMSAAETLKDSNDNIVITGWPMEYMQDILLPYKNMEKRNTVVFPHRLAPEKQLDIFKDLATQLPEYEFIVCQEQELTKNEYHNILGEAKVVFSANLQETLGISAYEGALVGAIPMMPNRLSYTEMYDDEFKYPSEWTESWDSYQKNKTKVVQKLKNYMENHGNYHNMLNTESARLTQNFFSGNHMYDTITKSDTPL